MLKDEKKTPMRVIPIELSDRREFCARYLSEPPHGGMVFQVREVLQEGELLELQLNLTTEQQRFDLRGLVLWRRQASLGVYDIGVGFLSTEAVKREALLKAPVARETFSERHERRFSITMKVTYETSTDFFIDYTRNISAGGLFVSSNSLPDLGTRILFKLYPPGEREPIGLEGQVAWHKPGQGFGVRFIESDKLERMRLDRLVKHIAMGTSVHPMAKAQSLSL